MTRLDDLSPLNVLRRGFAIVQDQDQKVLHQADQVTPGEILHICLEHGSVEAQVTQTEINHKHQEHPPKI